MRIALLGDFDVYAFRGLVRPVGTGGYRLSPALNLARGFRELGVPDVHYLVTTPEVRAPVVEHGPFGVLHRLPRPRFSGSGSLHLWRRKILWRELERIGPDVVHGQGTEEEYAFTAVTSRFPHVITFHGIMHRVHQVSPPPLFSTGHVCRWLETIVARQARHVIAISREVERFLAEQGSRARCYSIPNAMAPCYFAVQPRPRTAGDFRLLYVGAILPRKGVGDLVEALPRLPAARLRLIGPARPDYERTLRQQATRLGVAGQIEWLGVKLEDDIARVMADSDLLVLPSLVENMPMCIGEAFAAGVPVVSTTAAGIPDWVEHGQTGWLVPPGNAAALAEAMAGLLADPALRARLAAAARAKALARYTPRVVAEQTLAVYEQVVKSWR
jgi:glycosyltransferase involved in cell wall biosynthesis